MCAFAAESIVHNNLWYAVHVQYSMYVQNKMAVPHYFPVITNLSFSMVDTLSTDFLVIAINISL